MRYLTSFDSDQGRLVSPLGEIHAEMTEIEDLMARLASHHDVESGLTEEALPTHLKQAGP